MKILSSHWLHPLLLLFWIGIGTSLRLTHLASKPPWTDEFSTIVFSLGNSFRTVPLDQAITPDVLLQPLRPNPTTAITDVVTHLLIESNHPPLYFVLAHWWMQLWQPDSFGLASVWAARALPALFGSLSIPAIFGLSWLAFRSLLVAQLAAAMMAVSPYGIFLAQEARHYTLGILWVIASLCYLVIATRQIKQRTPLPIWVVVSWIMINFLGISTHYFFAITLCSEAIWLLVIRGQRDNSTRRQGEEYPSISSSPHLPIAPNPHCVGALSSPSPDLPTSPWLQIYTVAIGTLVGCLIWLPIFWQESHGGRLTDWIQGHPSGVLALINPVFQALAAWITMLYLLPVEAPSLLVVLASGLLMLVFLVWVLPILIRGCKIQLRQPATRFMSKLFGAVVLGAIAIFFFFAYVLGIDLTRGARYNFVYFPAVIVLIGASLAVCWYDSRKHAAIPGKTAVILIWLVGLFGGLTVVNNLGYHKYYRPELLVPLMQHSAAPVLIATTHKTHVQTGEMMGLARELKLFNPRVSPLFLLAHQAQNPETATITLQHTLNQLPRPLDLWLVNFHAPAKLNGCNPDPRSLPTVYGYEYQLYHCTVATHSA